MSDVMEGCRSLPIVFLAIYAFLLYRIKRKERIPKNVAFFHPNAAGRGGGERVLWAAVEGLINRPEVANVIIYSISVDRENILKSRNETFNFNPNKNDGKIVFRRLYFPFLLESRTYPIATIFGQSIGSVIVLLSGLFLTPLSEWPDIFIDSTGCPFTLPAAKILTGAKTHAYLHYPTMSNDMLTKVSERRADFNNKAIFTKNAILFNMKKLYYKIFLLSYRICGWFVDVAVGNSKWTVSRIQAVWNRSDIAVLYPPAAIGDWKQIKEIPAEEDKDRGNVLISLAQFRPEKNQALQIRVFAKVLGTNPDAVFWIIGGARNADDERLIEGLRKLAFEELGIPKSKIEFIVNASRSEVDRRLRKAKCAIHTMVDEHFGISLLEYLEAKTPTVCHRSGGPELDIFLPNEEFGYLAASEDEFVEKVNLVLQNFDSPEVRNKRINGYNSLERFLSDAKFGERFTSVFIT